jgi:hypothetical protein
MTILSGIEKELLDKFATAAVKAQKVTHGKNIDAYNDAFNEMRALGEQMQHTSSGLMVLRSLYNHPHDGPRFFAAAWTYEFNLAEARKVLEELSGTRPNLMRSYASSLLNSIREREKPRPPAVFIKMHPD